MVLRGGYERMEEINEYKNIIAVTKKLNEDAPKIMQLYKETEELSKQAISQQEQLKSITEQDLKKAEDLLKQADAGLKKMDKMLKKIQEVESKVQSKIERLDNTIQKEKIREEFQKKEEAEKKKSKAEEQGILYEQMKCLVDMIGSLAMNQENKDIALFEKEDYIANKTILELYNKFNHRLSGPLIVQNQRWRGDFCFVVDHIVGNGKEAIGLWFKNGEPKTEKNGHDRWENTSFNTFRIYSGASYNKIVATFPYWKNIYLKEDPENEIDLEDRWKISTPNGFLNIPDGIDEELPFN